MDGVSIQLILLIIIGVVMAISIIVGLVQGFRKNMFKFCATIVFWIVFWLSAGFVSEMLGKVILYNSLTYDLVSKVLPTVDSSYNATCLMDYVKIMVATQANIDIEVINDPGVVNTIAAICQIVLKIVWLILWVIIFFIIKFFVYRCCFRKYCRVSKRILKKLVRKQKRCKRYIAKKEAKYAALYPTKEERIANRVYTRKDKKMAKKCRKLEKKINYQAKNLYKNINVEGKRPTRKISIYRPLGLVSGMFRGALVSMLILCVFNSTIKLLPNDTNDDIVASTTQRTASYPSLYDFILDYCDNDPIVSQAIDMVKEYQNSTLMKITNVQFGNQAIDDMFVDAILSGKSNDYSFALRKEASLIIKVAEQACYVTDGFDIENVNWTALSKDKILAVQEILNILSDDDLIGNLGTTLVGVGLSLDAVKEYLPSNITKDEYDINWKQELQTIASLVGHVYSLKDQTPSGDLRDIDPFSLDVDTVGLVIEDLSNLQLINFAGHVGISYGFKQILQGKDGYEDLIANIENKLAAMTKEAYDENGKPLNNTFGDSIRSFKGLYAEFINIYKDEVLEQYKNDKGMIEQDYYLAAITSIDPNRYGSMINTILESNFAIEILPDVLQIVKDNYIPQEYVSLINPNVVTTPQWEDEVNAVLKIAHDLIVDKEGVVHPFENIEKYDFSLLSNFTVDTVVNSDLLSYAMIKIFIDTSKSQGILSSQVGNIANYMAVPDGLANDYDETTHRFNEKWYGEDGELAIMLGAIKDCGSKLENIRNYQRSLPAIVAAIPVENLMKSDILYYSVNKLLKQHQDLVIIPVTETEDSSDTLNGQIMTNMVKRDALVQLFNILVKDDIIDYDQLLVYYAVDDYGNPVATPTPKEEIPAEDLDKYHVELDTSRDALLRLATSKKIYDPETKDDSKLQSVFSSNILKATITYLVTTKVGNRLVIPSSATLDPIECFVAKNGTLVTENVSMIKEKEFTALISAFSSLQLDVGKVMDSVSSGDTGQAIVDIIDSLKDPATGKLKKEVSSLLGGGLDGDYDIDPNESVGYSSILHATLSKYLIDFSNRDDSSIKIVVPQSALDSNDSSLIKGTEVVDLVTAITVIGTDAFLNKDINQNDLIDTILNNVIADTNHESLDSLIIRATLTNYIDTQAEGLSIPEAALMTDVGNDKITAKEHIVDLLDALAALKEAKNAKLPEGQKVNFSDLLDVDNLEVSMLYDANKGANAPLSKSLILRGILTTQVENNGYEIPTEVKVDNIISEEETTNLINALHELLGANASLSNINIDNITFGELESKVDDISESKVIRTIITQELIKQEAIKIPTNAYDPSISSVNCLSSQQLKSLMGGVSKLLGKDVSVNNVNIDNLKISSLVAARDDIAENGILNATVTAQLLSDDLKDTIVVPEDSLSESEDVATINENEMKYMIDGLASLFDNDPVVTEIKPEEIYVKNIVASNVHLGRSSILNATVTKQLLDQEKESGVIVVPSEALNGEKLDSGQMEQFVDGIGVLLSPDDSVANINTDNIKIANLAKAKENIKNSLVLNAIITKQLKDNEDINVPDEAYSTVIADQKTITETQTEDLIDGLVALLGDSDSSITDIDMDTIKISKLDVAKTHISDSSILNSTITKQIRDQKDDNGNNLVVVPAEAYNASYADDSETPMLTKGEMTNLLTGLVTLLKTDGPNEPTVTNLSIDSVTLNKIADSTDVISDSLVLNATITKQLLDQDGSVVIPSSAYATKETLKDTEISNFFGGLNELVDGSAPVSNLDVDSTTVAKLYKSRTNIANSLVLNATITNQIADESLELTIPDSAYESDSNKTLLTESEIDNLFTGLNNMVNDPETTIINDIDVNSFKLAKLHEASANIYSSKILNATIAKSISEPQNELTIPDAAYESGSNKTLLTSSEINNLFEGLNKLVNDKDATVNNINVNAETIKIKDLDNASENISSSYILNATITTELKDLKDDNNNNIIAIPANAYNPYIHTDHDSIALYDDQMTKLITGLSNLFNKDSTVNDIDIDNITTGKLKECGPSIADSLVLNATITKQLEDQDGVVVPSTATNKTTRGDIDTLIDTEMINFTGVVVTLFGEEIPLENLPFDELTLGKLADSTAKVRANEYPITSSLVIKATITKNITDTNSKDENGQSGLITPSDVFDSSKILTDTEINSVLNALSVIFEPTMTIANLGDLDFTKALSLKKVTANISAVNDSLILRATISDSIAKSDAIRLPSNSIEKYTDYDDEAADLKGALIDVITKDELRYFFEAVDSIYDNENASINDIDASSIKVNVKNSGNITESTIMRATVTANFSFKTEGVAEENQIAAYALDSDVDLDETAKMLILNKDELGNLIKSLGILSDGGIDNVEINLDALEKLYDNGAGEGKIRVLLESNTIRIAISELLERYIPYMAIIDKDSAATPIEVSVYSLEHQGAITDLQNGFTTYSIDDLVNCIRLAPAIQNYLTTL